MSQQTISERDQRVEAVMKELAPKIEEVVRQMVENVVSKPEKEELGAVEYELRDSSHQLAALVQEASMASRKKRGT